MTTINTKKVSKGGECKMLGMLSGTGWDCVFERSRRVYSTEGIAPTICSHTSSNSLTKVLVYEGSDA